MGRKQPILQGVVSTWEDGVRTYGYDGGRDGSFEVYLLAHTEKEYHIAREEDTDKMDLREMEFKLYSPDELSVDEYESLQDKGYHFHRITDADLIRMLRAGFDGRECS